MNTSPTRQWVGIACVILAAAGFSLKGIYVKLTIAEGVSVPSLMIWRYLLALIFFWGFALWRYNIRQVIFLPKTALLLTIAAGFMGYYLGTYADYRALELLDATVSRFILFTFPVFVVAWHSLIERKLPPPRQVAAIITIQVGMYFLLLADGRSFPTDSMEGAAWGFAAAFSYAIYLILIQKTGKNIPSPIIATWVVTTASIITLIEFSLMGRWSNEFEINSTAFYLLLQTAIFSTFLPIILIAESIRRIGSSRSALISAFSPFFTIILAFLLLNEVMTPNQWIGGLVIFLSVLILEGKLPVRKLFRRTVA